MKLGQLIERLQEYQEELGDDVEIRIATQPNYPLEYLLDGLCSLTELHSCEEAEEVSREHRPPLYYGGEGPEQVIYLTTGRQEGYGSRKAWLAAETADH